MLEQVTVIQTTAARPLGNTIPFRVLLSLVFAILQRTSHACILRTCIILSTMQRGPLTGILLGCRHGYPSQSQGPTVSALWIQGPTARAGPQRLLQRTHGMLAELCLVKVLPCETVASSETTCSASKNVETLIRNRKQGVIQRQPLSLACTLLVCASECSPCLLPHFHTMLLFPHIFPSLPYYDQFGVQMRQETALLLQPLQHCQLRSHPNSKLCQSFSHISEATR